MRLEILVVFAITPWALADSDYDGNKTTVESSTSTYIDETRRDAPHQLLEDQFKIASQPLQEQETYNDETNGFASETSVAMQRKLRLKEDDNNQNDDEVKDGSNLRILGLVQNTIPVKTEMNGICDNAEFLIKILTTMIHLLKQDVPERSRTSYVLEILKDVLKASPEAGKDNEVMYKINDLMQTLEKYHVDNLGNQNLLGNNALHALNGVKTKVVFKYEMPHFQNIKCTAELLMVIKVVQEAIMRLVNNPVCRADIVATDVPFLTNVDTLLTNSYLYSSFSLGVYPPNIIPNDFNVVYTNIYPNSRFPFLPYQSNPSNEPLNLIPDLPGALSIFPNPSSIIPNLITSEVLGPGTQHLTPKVTDSNQEVPILEINFPGKEYIPTVDQIQTLPYHPNILNIYESNTETSFDYQFNPSSQGKNPLYPNMNNPLPLYYGASPIGSPMINGGIKPFPSIDVFGVEGNGYFPLDSSTPIPYVEVYKPSNRPSFDGKIQGNSEPDSVAYTPPNESPYHTIPQKPAADFKPYLFPLDENTPADLPSDDSSQSLFEIDSFQSSEHFPLDETPIPSHDYFPIDSEQLIKNPNNGPFKVTGDGFGEINIGQGQPPPETVLDTGKLPNLPFEVIGNDGSAYVKLNENVNSLNIIDQLWKKPNFSLFDVVGDGLGEIPIGEIHPKGSANKNLYPSPIKVIGNGGSADIDIGHKQPDYLDDFDVLLQKPTELPFDVSGGGSGFVQISQEPLLPDNVYKPIGQPSPKPLNKIINPEIKTPNKNEYDTAPNSIPTINGVPVFYPEVLSSPNHDTDSDRPRPGNPYLPEYSSDYYIPTKKTPLFPPFEATGDGLFEIKSSPIFNSTPKPAVVDFGQHYPSKDIPSYPGDHLVPNQEEIINLYPSRPEHSDYFGIPDDSYALNKFTSIVNKPKSPQNIYLPENNVQFQLPSKDLISFYPYLPYQDYTWPNTNIPPDWDTSVPETPYQPSINNLLPYPIRPKEIDWPSHIPQVDIEISKPNTPYRPGPQNEDQYAIPTQNEFLYDDVLGSAELSYIDTDTSTNDQPIIWDNVSPDDIPNINMPEYGYPTAPDKNVLVLIKNNIEVIEQKISKMQLDSVIREHMKIIKELINLKEITIEEYVTILHEYEILIEYIKNLNIDHETLQELLLSMTNGGKLNLHTGKSNLVELTYLIKRPTPLVYQPYYYIKYHLPYTSFMTNMETILAKKPLLSKYPSELYKALIHMSKVAETSPDLEGYGKDDIVKLTHSNGTLVGSKIIKGKDIDIYATLDMLKKINIDLTVDDVYKLIKKFDEHLKSSAENAGAFIGNIKPNPITNSIDNFKLQVTPNNYENLMDKITLKINRKPTLAKKITKITTKKVSDDVIVDILNQVNNLRSNKSSYETVGNEIILPESDTKINSTLQKFQDVSSVNQLQDSINVEQQNDDSTDNKNLFDTNGKIMIKEKLAFDYIPMYSDSSKEHLNYYSKMNSDNGDNVDSHSEEDFEMNKLNFNPTPVEAQPSLSIYDKLKDATINADKSLVKSNFHQFDSNSDAITLNNSAFYNNEPGKKWKSSLYGQPDSNNQQSVGAKLLDATLKAHDFKQASIQQSPNLDFQSSSLSLTPDYSKYTNEKPNILNTNMQEQYKTFAFDKHDSDYPNVIKTSYSFNNPNNVFSNFDENGQIYDMKTLNSNTMNPSLNKYYEKYTIQNPVPFANYYKTDAIDNPNNLAKQYQAYSFNNINDDNYNVPKKYEYLMNYNQRLQNNNMDPRIKFYQKQSKNPFLFLPSRPIRIR